MGGRAPYLSLAKFALSLARSRSAPAIVLTPTRAPSPAPTEIVEPESEQILTNLAALNIKVRDFAYSDSASSSCPVAELFDPYRALAEYEYRLRTTPHIPIPGKSMHRLLAVGWVPQEEATARLRPIDLQAMHEYDTRNTGYPYRTMRWNTVPTAQEREALLQNFAPFFRHLDKVQDELRMEEEWEEQERLLGEEAGERVAQRLEEIRERERRNLETRAQGEKPPPPMSANKKRALERSPSTPTESTTTGPKRLKLSPDARYPAHAQQYPAPLQAYDPALYPHAASVIAAEDRPRPGQDVTVTPPASDDEADYALGVLQRKKNAKKKGLVRTQTFAQL